MKQGVDLVLKNNPTPKLVLKAMKGTIYKYWFAEAVIKDRENQLIIFAKSSFLKDWIQNNLSSQLERLLNIKLPVQLQEEKKSGVKDKMEIKRRVMMLFKRVQYTPFNHTKIKKKV